jgi:hypothetical protein
MFVVLASALVNCSGVDFGTKDGQTGSSNSATSIDPGKNGDSTDGGVNQGSDPSGNNPGGPTTEALPKIQFVGPPCQRGTQCLIEFVLDAPVAKIFEFDWRTNDNLYKSAVPAGATYIYGRPNYHYVPASGHIIFAAGETKKQAFIENINPDNIEIVIGVTMSLCTYGGNIGNCTSFFH